ncbi:MAG: host attachment protein, partial [Planctomycetota bacterium]
MSTWVLVADTSRARIYSFEGPEQPWCLRLAAENPHGRLRSREIATDRPGHRCQCGHKGLHSSATTSRDPTSVVEQRFVEHLADVLEKGFDANEFRRLVLV